MPATTATVLSTGQRGNMTIRELLQALIGHAADGRKLEDEVLIRVGDETRAIDSSYMDGTFVLIAGKPVR